MTFPVRLHRGGIPTCPAWRVPFIRAEVACGAKLVHGIPERWFEGGKFRCEKGHVSTTNLLLERCVRAGREPCFSQVWLTFPEDEDGPLPVVAIEPCTTAQ